MFFSSGPTDQDGLGPSGPEGHEEGNKPMNHMKELGRKWTQKPSLDLVCQIDQCLFAHSSRGSGGEGGGIHT